MIRGFLLMLGLFAVAAAITFHGLAGRYELLDNGTRIDRLTGEACLYLADRGWVACATDGEPPPRSGFVPLNP